MTSITHALSKKATAAFAITVIPATCLAYTNSSAHADAPNAGDKYVALGDSYAATGTVSKRTPNASFACVQDQDNYPHQLANKLGLNLDDASCSWALTYQYDQPQNHALPGTAPAPQKEHLTQDTKLITISLGGNDAGLADVFAQCAPHIHTPGLPDCKDTAEPTATAQINNPDPQGRTLHQRLVDIANDARQRSPHAKIVFTGYYTAAMKDYRCIDDGFLSDNDRAFLEQYVANINKVIKSAAEEANVTYVAPPNQPDGWCSPPNERNSSYFGIPEGSLIAHPTPKGQQRMADSIANQI